MSNLKFLQEAHDLVSLLVPYTHLIEEEVAERYAEETRLRAYAFIDETEKAIDHLMAHYDDVADARLREKQGVPL